MYDKTQAYIVRGASVGEIQNEIYDSGTDTFQFCSMITYSEIFLEKDTPFCF